MNYLSITLQDCSIYSLYVFLLYLWSKLCFFYCVVVKYYAIVKCYTIIKQCARVNCHAKVRSYATPCIFAPLFLCAFALCTFAPLRLCDFVLLCICTSSSLFLCIIAPLQSISNHLYINIIKSALLLVTHIPIEITII